MDQEDEEDEGDEKEDEEDDEDDEEEDEQDEQEGEECEDEEEAGDEGYDTEARQERNVEAGCCALASASPSLTSQYTLCDIILLCQVYYYRQYESSLPPPCERHRPHPAPTAAGAAGATETSPLLPPSSPLSLSHSLTSLTHPVPEPHQPKPLLPPYLEYPLLIAFVLAAGVGGWYLTDASDEIGIPEGPGKGDGVELEWKSQVLGYMSAVLYLGSRIPQIIHN